MFFTNKMKEKSKFWGIIGISIAILLTISLCSIVKAYYGIYETSSGGYTHTTNVYRCSNGEKDYLGEVSYGDHNFCTDPKDNNYIRQGDSPSGVCYPPNQEPKTCYEKFIDCYKIEGGKCVHEMQYPFHCIGFEKFQDLDECIKYTTQEKGKNIQIFLIIAVILFIVILVILIKKMTGDKNENKRIKENNK